MTCKTGGFTLAEVLITLGILGVVASLTMPGLIRDYQARVYQTAAMVFENRLEQALQQMNIAEDLTGYTKTEDFVEALKKYMKIIKTCDKTNLKPCFSENVNDLEVRELEFLGTTPWGTDNMAFVLQNGTTALIKYNPNCQSPGIAAKGSDLRNCIAISYDTNGLKKPNEAGRDIGGDANFLIMLSNGLRMTSGDVQYTPINTCSSSHKYYRAGATATCANDYWAGAMQKCEDLKLRLPTSPINTGCGFFEAGRTSSTNPSGVKITCASTASTSKSTTEPYIMEQWLKAHAITRQYYTSTLRSDQAGVVMLVRPSRSDDPGGRVTGSDNNRSASGIGARCVTK